MLSYQQQHGLTKHPQIYQISQNCPIFSTKVSDKLPVSQIPISTFYDKFIVNLFDMEMLMILNRTYHP